MNEKVELSKEGARVAAEVAGFSAFLNTCHELAKQTCGHGCYSFIFNSEARSGEHHVPDYGTYEVNCSQNRRTCFTAFDKIAEIFEKVNQQSIFAVANFKYEANKIVQDALGENQNK